MLQLFEEELHSCVHVYTQREMRAVNREITARGAYYVV